MKCPKCGYNSFEYHDACKKCSNDLTNYKETFGLKTIVLPSEARTAMAEAMSAATPEADLASEPAETATDIFSFDLPDDEAPGATAAGNDNPFNFDEEPAEVQPTSLGDFSFDEEQKSPQAKAEEDAFADLLESTAHDDSAAIGKPSSAKSGPGEFDLENFSWDDTPAATNSAEKKSDDDFNSLFGDMDETTKK